MNVETMPATWCRNSPMFFVVSDTYREARTLVTLRQAFARDSYVALPQLLTDEAFSLLKEEVRGLERLAAPKDFTMPGYETPRLMATLGGRDIPRASPLLTTLYLHHETRELIRRITGGEVHTCRDLNEWAVLNWLVAPAATHGWHLDDPPLALIIFIDAPEEGSGGEMEYIRDWPRICSAHGAQPDGPAADLVHLCREAGLVHTESHRAGDAYLLRADQCLHRVTPLAPGAGRRVVINMALEVSPNIMREGVTARRLYERQPGDEGEG